MENFCRSRDIFDHSLAVGSFYVVRCRRVCRWTYLITNASPCLIFHELCSVILWAVTDFTIEL
jgi:hypothetical protein